MSCVYYEQRRCSVARQRVRRPANRHAIGASTGAAGLRPKHDHFRDRKSKLAAARMEIHATTTIAPQGCSPLARRARGILPPNAKYMRASTGGPERMLVNTTSQGLPSLMSRPSMSQPTNAPPAQMYLSDLRLISWCGFIRPTPEWSYAARRAPR